MASWRARPFLPALPRPQRGPLAELFESRQLLTDVSGSGNNWAHGYGHHGPQYREALSDVIRCQARLC